VPFAGKFNNSNKSDVEAESINASTHYSAFTTPQGNYTNKTLAQAITKNIQQQWKKK
jgi:hypothetical protein